MKKIFKIMRGKKGSGIMTVMLAITFLTAFGTLAMYLSYTSFQVAVSDRASKEVTLTASTCMDEIKAGLQDIVSDAIKETYREVMPNYISKGFEIQKDFAKSYFDYVANGVGNESVDDGDYLLQIPESNGVYSNGLYYADTGVGDDGEPEGSVKTLASLIKEHRGYDVQVSCVGVPNGALTGTAEVVYDENDDSENPLPRAIILKGVKVTVSSGRLSRSSSVTADIKIGVPNIGYSLSPYTLAGIPEFVFICKGELRQSGLNKNCRISGSSYAGSLKLENTSKMTVDSNSVMIVKDGISVDGALSLTTCSNHKIVKPDGTTAVKPNVSHNKAGRFVVSNNSTLWAGNINIGEKSSVKLLGKTFVKNDLSFNGKQSYAELKGSYYGFGSGENDAGNSSAIYSVGVDSEINMDGLNQLTLSGVTFLTDTDENISDDDRLAYRTGNSELGYLDQLLYYAPYGSIEKREFRSDFPEQFASDGNLLYLKQNNGHIVVYYKDTGTYKFGEYKEGIDFSSIEDWSNPDDFLDWLPDEEFDPATEDSDLEPGQSKMAVFTAEEYNKIYEFRLKSDYIEDLDKSYSDYGATLQPYRKNNGDSVIVYFFLKFDTQQHANQYFIDYFDAYVRSGNALLKRNLENYLMMVGDPGLQSSVGTIYSSGSPTMGNIDNYEVDSEQIRQNSQVLERMFYMYCKTLSNVDAELSDEELENIESPYDYYVNKDAVNSLLPESSAKDEQYFYNKNKGVAVITRKGEFVYTGTGAQKDLCLILATGNVKVNGNFKGLIICNGNIIVDENCTFTNNAINVVMSFTSETNDLPKGQNRQLKEFFNIDFTEIYTESVSGSGDAWNVAKLVGYETWTRE